MIVLGAYDHADVLADHIHRVDRRRSLSRPKRVPSCEGGSQPSVSSVLRN